ncbi:MAG: hypothetical protein K9G59_13350 [Caulobacter sp.]|nr:hypothetical protein [Caulobacter sp.]
MRTGLALALSMMALGATAKPPPEFVHPEWLTRPTSEQMSIHFNKTPSCHGDRMFTGGSAVVECGLMVDGRLKACVVTKAEPWDCAYGEMSLAIMPYFRAKPRLPDGRKITPGMKVRIPMRYEAPAG